MQEPVYEDELTYACIKIGYHVASDNTKTRTYRCGADKSWGVAYEPCTLIHCPLPPYEHASIAETDREFDSWATVTCDTGYEYGDLITTTEIMQCQDSGSYADIPPDCQSSALLPVTLRVERTMELHGKLQHAFLLEEHGPWAHLIRRLRGVTIVHCPELTGGNLTVSTNETSWLTEVMVTCPLGSEFLPDQTSLNITCHANSEWSASLPECSRVRCPNPGYPEHGKRVGDEFRYHDYVTYSCGYGRELYGKATIMCTHDKTWSRPVPVCVKHCPMLLDLQYAVAVPVNEYNQMTTIWCFPNYEYILARSTMKTSVCTADKVWDTTELDCDLRRCRALDPGRSHATWNYTETLLPVFGTYVLVTCNIGYMLPGTDDAPRKLQHASCSKDTMTWAPPIVDCEGED
ncbi:PREDICTED: CUB and sushi domain-containing protein 3-like [Priapulus caudatus]|uniref:CUB and sushi domain-containing protein 3-like n=1 Tax=Priapulus caudatus TaxID=37621 RepID=A0ABM1F3G8_PRICU|nr:PREDICTED: CUB and sushi domain-containing protein 3-like [Priapulus caudatus]